MFGLGVIWVGWRRWYYMLGVGLYPWWEDWRREMFWGAVVVEGEGLGKESFFSFK